jgi:hypothetical protein
MIYPVLPVLICFGLYWLYNQFFPIVVDLDMVESDAAFKASWVSHLY